MSENSPASIGAITVASRYTLAKLIIHLSKKEEIEKDLCDLIKQARETEGKDTLPDTLAAVTELQNMLNET